MVIKGSVNTGIPPFQTEQHYVIMRDGVKLAATVILPNRSTGPRPVVFQYLPYHRFSVNPKTCEIVMAYNEEWLAAAFINHGYVFVIADMRGSGASYGKRHDMDPRLGLDGKELIDWIAAQPWCDGNVGMMGGSYHGWSQFATAGHKPAALKCIMADITAFDIFTDGLFAGGIKNLGVLKFLGSAYTLLDTNACAPEAQILPALPVLDEDGDGVLHDEIPLDRNESGSFLDDGWPPTYSDGNQRAHIYYRITKEHLDNITLAEWADRVKFRDDVPDASSSLVEKGPNDWPVHIAESGIAVYVIGAWFDMFALGAFRWFATLQRTNPSKLLIHPSFHSIPEIRPDVGPYWEHFGLDLDEYSRWILEERFRFFDRYLKGVDNGIDRKPPVRIYVMNGSGWRDENEWPLDRQVMTDFYVDVENRLSLHPTSSPGFDDYRADFNHSSRYSKSLGTRWIPQTQPASIMKRTEHDQKCLTYTSPPLNEDTEVTGHPVATFWVSSTAAYGDFFVYLEDVDDNDEAYYITEGSIRAGFAELKPKEEILLSRKGIEVLPDLPWHGFKRKDYRDGILANNTVVKLVIALYPTSWVIKKGHRIRVSVACADWPTFELHSRLSPTNDPSDKDNIIPIVKLYRNPQHPSRISLPIIQDTESGTGSD